MRYRRATTSDLIRIKELEESSELAEWSIDDYTSVLESKNYLLVVADEDGDGTVLAGFILLRIITNHVEGGLIEVMNIAVDDAFKRRGIGSRLVSESIQLSNIIHGSVELELRESNRVAMHLYESLGFSVVGSRPSYYSSPEESAILMTLEF